MRGRAGSLALQILGWSVLSCLGLLGMGGAASSLEGLQLSWPRAPGIALLGLGCLGLLALRPRPATVTAWIGLGWVPVALLLGLRLPGLAALSGPPLLALALAGVLAALAAARVSGLERAFFPIVLVVYCVVAGRVQRQVGAEGDEPHYLMVAESLLHDHDVDLTDDYVKARYQAFYRGETLEPHYRVRGKQDRIYSLHAVGLSVLILPAYAVGGYAAASFFMAFLAAFTAREIRLLVRDWGGPAWVPWVVALSPPLVHYAGLVFTEVPAALGVALALRHGRTPRTGAARLAWVGAVLAVLPWLNVRYVPLSLILAAYVLWGEPLGRRTLALLTPLLLSAFGLAAYHEVLYGFADPRRVYGARPELALAQLPEGLQGLFLDQEFGLLVVSPFLVLAIPGLIALVREGRRRDALVGLGLVGVTVLTAASWPMWRGGFNPPGRFLVPVVPVLAALASVGLRSGLGARTALLAGWSLWLGLSGAAQPRLVHRDRDGTAPLLRAESGALEWTRLLPGYVLAEPDRHRLAGVWAVTLLLAAWPRRRAAPTAATFAVATAGLVAAAAIAQSLSGARAGGREAVHVLARPCLGVPGSVFAGSCEAEWSTAVLDWGPAYEPHRHPAGALLGSRLELPEGQFRVIVEGDELAPGGPPPTLRLEAEVGRVVALRETPLSRDTQGYAAGFAVLAGERRTSLRLWGGSAFIVRRIRLVAQPSPGPTV
jgi:hypothetical protein